MSAYFNEKQLRWAGNQARLWWSALQHNGEQEQKKAFYSLGRADRARCARCASLQELEYERAPLLLLESLTQGYDGSNADFFAWLKKDSMALLLIAGVLVHVRTDSSEEKSLMQSLGFAAVKKDERPKLSELRFRRLLAEDSYEDFFHAMRRTVKLSDSEGVNVSRLAIDLLEWTRQHANAERNSVKFRWAQDYYLSGKDRLSVEESRETETEKEN